MKKILISVVIILLIILCAVAATKSISIGSLKIESINQIKDYSNNLDNKYSQATTLSETTYPKEIEDIEKAVKRFETAKQQYENIVKYNSEEITLGLTQIEKYNIEFLWTILGNYATRNNINLTLDIKQGQAKDIYDLGFNLEGTYSGIIEFLYDLEDNEELNFKIENFEIAIEKSALGAKMSTPSGLTANLGTTEKKEETKENTKEDTTTKKPANYGITLYAAFNVDDVAINLQ